MTAKNATVDVFSNEKDNSKQSNIIECNENEGLQQIYPVFAWFAIDGNYEQ